ncbi:hypothetical protein [Jeotgalibacillus soli]|uniref:Uncharacterized protein n=1 Tax=Jeotgalibacillus soli TaxID=889306 RepID=A0A0C2S5C3_9BACL|nr:hypothetical protein [Jeotgalibacillus soli]KIL49229.1 hypothetical protein KP78_06960 [Jeotgalibacillus soli]
MSTIEWYNINALIFSSSQAALLLSFFTTWLIIRQTVGKDAANHASNLFFAYVLVWKFSSVLFYWDFIWRAPMSVIYYNGGLYGMWIATITVVILYAIRVKKQEEWRKIGIKTWVLVLLLFEGYKAVLTYSMWTDGLWIAGYLFILIGVLTPKIALLKEAPFMTLLVVLALQWLSSSINGEAFHQPLLAGWLISAVLMVFNRKEIKS